MKNSNSACKFVMNSIKILSSSQPCLRILLFDRNSQVLLKEQTNAESLMSNYDGRVAMSSSPVKTSRIWLLTRHKLARAFIGIPLAIRFL